MTDEQVALILDPKRERAGWWRAFRACPKCGKDVFRCPCVVEVHTASLPMGWDYTGPPITTCRVAAFTHVTPVLEACGCSFVISKLSTHIYLPSDCKSGGAYRIDPAVTAAALAWLAEHEPERLVKALGVELEACSDWADVGGGN